MNVSLNNIFSFACFWTFCKQNHIIHILWWLDFFRLIVLPLYAVFWFNKRLCGTYCMPPASHNF
jgi:hypothetical protein